MRRLARPGLSPARGWAQCGAAGPADRLPCGARAPERARNSLHSLRSLRSDKRAQSDDDARLRALLRPAALLGTPQGAQPRAGLRPGDASSAALNANARAGVGFAALGSCAKHQRCRVFTGSEGAVRRLARPGLSPARGWAQCGAAGPADRLPCGARAPERARNSLHSLRSLRSDKRAQSDDDARLRALLRPAALLGTPQGASRGRDWDRAMHRALH